MKIVETVKTAKETATQLFKGVENLALAASVTIVSFYNAYDLLNRPVDNFEYYVRMTASIIVAGVGAYAIGKVLIALGKTK